MLEIGPRRIRKEAATQFWTPGLTAWVSLQQAASILTGRIVMAQFSAVLRKRIQSRPRLVSIRIMVPARSRHVICRLKTLLAATLLLCMAGLVEAQVCQVPRDHPAIQNAVTDTRCTEIQLVERVYEESVHVTRSIVITGPLSGAAVLRGTLSVDGRSVLASLSNFSIENGCEGPGLSVMAGAELQALNLPVSSSSQFACITLGESLFSDSFESL